MGVRKILRKRSRVLLVVPLVLLVAGASTGAWLLTRDTSAAVTPTTATVTSGTMKETVAASGTVEPARTADLDFDGSGTVTHVYVAEGDHVTKGQALAAIDAAALKASRTAAAASLAAAYTQLDDDTTAAATDTQLAADNAAIVAARGALTDARDAVAAATLRSTIKGTVVSLDVAKGDVVGASNGAATGTTTTSAVTVVSTRKYTVEATVAAADVESLKQGLQAEITPTGATDMVYGTVSSVGLVAETNDSGAAVFPVTIEVTGTQKSLYAGTAADVSIIVKQVPGVLSVPSRALQTDGDTTYVNKIVNGKSVKTTVKTGTTYGPSTEVTSGLKEGETVEIPGFTRAPAGGTGEAPQGFPGGGGGFPAGGLPGGRTNQVGGLGQ
ncbi:efflux RND transporter periplasmic adaptor subunit [Nocardioides sp.]|uniref:efflux RND transporter periplasmic adaptor subunit n=1 Tax=Nocardioides sp. TaxID=35761 RepID=UPI0031FEF37B|nr:Membrane fusion protein macrolide-specific efflux system [Nocardioides sp.]